MNEKSSLVANLTIYGGLSLMAAPICLAAFIPRIPIWLAILVGVAVGSPMLIIGFRLHPESTRNHSTGPKHFLPTRTEAWAMLGLFTFFFAYSVPIVLFFLLFLMMPAGDNGRIVIVRILVVTASICASRWWITFAQRKFPAFFQGKLSDEIVDSFRQKQSPPAPSNAMEAVLKNWHLMVVAATAFFVSWGFMNLNNPLFNLALGPRQLGKFARPVDWFRNNPNTVLSSSALVGFGASMLYGFRVRRAHILSKSMEASSTQDDGQEKRGRSGRSSISE